MLADLAPLLLGALLGWTGGGKLTGTPDPDSAPAKAIPRFHAPALRALGAVEVALAAALLVRPLWTPGGWAAAALGVGFVGYLLWARSAAPDSSCGCTSRGRAPVGARSFARAWLVVAGGVAATRVDRPWWTATVDRPVAALAAVLAAAVLLALLSPEVWLLPVRRLRHRIRPAHDRAAVGPGAAVPVAASIELLEQSLAWHTAAPVVRSALLEHWDDDGWRFLRFAGARDDRPVTVLFALDPTASTETTAEPAVRLSVLDDALVA